tara:strand:- start:1588 stop:1929 length:342 start_codon:yes stop_codon:yes gene_type:complete
MDEFKTRPEDFTIRVRPLLDRDKNWTGEIDVVIITQPHNALSDDDYYQVMHICKMISSVIPLMEKDVKLRDTVNDYVVNKLDKDYTHDITKDSKIEKIEDNIIRINFRPETKH